MKIGIDISQLAHPGTGVANYLQNLVEHLLQMDQKNEYILFYASLRKPLQDGELWSNGQINSEALPKNASVTIAQYKFPPVLLDFLWNRLHIFPIEKLIGSIDIFITSDWVEPPSQKAKKATILYDLIVYTYPEETHNQTNFSLKNLHLSANIVASQKRRLKWVRKESDAIFCISESTKQDAMKLLHISPQKLHVLYPGI